MTNYTEPQEKMTDLQFWFTVVATIIAVFTFVIWINGGMPNDCCPNGCASTCAQMEKADESNITHR